MITSEQINSMNYVEFISFIQETNRCPGGKFTIHDIAKESLITKKSMVLEIGSNTGFSSLELSRISGCKCVGIEPVRDAVKIANKIKKSDIYKIRKNVKFICASAYNIPFKSNKFDLIVAGGATSFMDNKKKAIEEYYRVLKPWGLLSVTNLFYQTRPPKKVLDNLEKVLGIRIQPWSDKEWLELIVNNSKLNLYLLKKYKLFPKSNKELEEYVEFFIKKQHIKKLPENVKKTIYDKWLGILKIFNENHKYLGFFFALFRKDYIFEEPELFNKIEIIE